MSVSEVANELFHYLSSHENGCSDDELKKHFGDRYAGLATGINELLSINRLQLFQQGGALVYKAIKESTAIKFEGLAPEQILVYQVIERATNKGIWTRDIKLATNIPQHSLTKTLKTLEQRGIIKSVRSVMSKSKKLYMISEMEPAKELTGGPWYSDQEFDHDFVHELNNAVVRVVSSKGMISLKEINDIVKNSGITKVELTLEEMELLVNTLVFDGRLEAVQSSVLVATSGYAATNTMYKATQAITVPDYLGQTPCGVCPIVSNCTEGGVINPHSCLYMSSWLDMAAKMPGDDVVIESAEGTAQTNVGIVPCSAFDW